MGFIFVNLWANKSEEISDIPIDNTNIAINAIGSKTNTDEVCKIDEIENVLIPVKSTNSNEDIKNDKSPVIRE